MKIIKLLVTATVFGVLWGCSATPEQCDPSKPQSVFQKMNCLGSGSYDTRVEQKKNTLAMEEQKNSQAHKLNKQVEAKKKSSQRTLAKKRAEVKKLNAALASYSQKLQAKAQGKEDILQQIDNVQQKAKNINSSTVSEAQKQAELLKLQQKLATLEQAIGL